jgi:transcriptional regulator with XRE-family HTH domain
MTMTELARALHVSRPTVSLWERGGRKPARHYWPLLGSVLALRPAEVAPLFADHPPARHDGEPLPSLALVRRRKGLTQHALARLIEVAPTTLSMWETAGVRVPPGVAAEIARVLDTDLLWLAAEPRRRAVVDPRPLRRLRKQAGMSQREAAAYLGIAVGTLARYEAGERQAPVAVVRRMAKAYGRSVEELLHSGCEVPPLPRGVRYSRISSSG